MFRVIWKDQNGENQSLIVEDVSSKKEAIEKSRKDPNGPGMLKAQAVFVPGN